MPYRDKILQVPPATFVPQLKIFPSDVNAQAAAADYRW